MDAPGDRLGPYELVAPVGAGGYGTVWRATRRTPFEQTVAVKIVKPGMDSQAVLARFEAERQVLARMDDPGIARVFDGGMTAAGRPYFVMEFVDGLPITRFADEQRLDLAARVALVARACDAVQHAHAKGVIHRDLKPSNILVGRDGDGRAVVKVIDFGIAKSLGGAGAGGLTITEDGQVMGTPEYMSPEQADPDQPDVDTRSDVYALGAVLYELLCGAAPFGISDGKTQSRAQMLRALAEATPERPSVRLARDLAAAACRGGDPAGLARTLRRDLDWVPMMALRKEPAQRYASASELARDLRDWLDGRTVRAAPESTVYRLRTYARRHRVQVAAGATVAVALLAATGVSSWFAWSASKAREAALARAEESRRVAAFQSRIVSSIDPAWVGAQIMQDLVNQHASRLKATVPDADTRKARRDALWQEQALIVRPDLGREVIERWILKPTSDGIAAEFADIPVAEAAMRHALADRYLTLGEAALARDEALKAYELRRTHLSEDHLDAIASASLLGRIEWYRGDHAAALALQTKAAESFERALGPSASESMRARQDRARVLASLDAASAAEAVAELEAIVAQRTAVQGAEHAETAGAERDLGAALATVGRFGEAERVLRAALAKRERTIGPDAPGTISTKIRLVECLWRLGDRNAAAEFGRDALGRAVKQLGSNDIETLHLEGTLASILAEVGSPEALAEGSLLADHAATASARIFGPRHATALHALLAQARIALARGDLAGTRSRLSEFTTRTEAPLAPTDILRRDHDALRRRADAALPST